MSKKKNREKVSVSYEELCALDLEKSVQELEDWYLYNKDSLQGTPRVLRDPDEFQVAIQRVWNVADTLKTLGKDRVQKDIDLAIQAQDPIDDQGDVEWEGSF